MPLICAPDNPLAYYFRRVLRMQQAALAWDWLEDSGPRNTRLVAVTPHNVVPNTKSMYELAATMDFEKAIDLARTFRFLNGEAILPDQLGTKAALEPTVGDLLIALEAEKFVGKAHLALGNLFLERDALELAELHLDAAVQEGINVVLGYRLLGEAYGARGQDTDATRAFLKATKFSGEKEATQFIWTRSKIGLIFLRHLAAHIADGNLQTLHLGLSRSQPMRHALPP